MTISLTYSFNFLMKFQVRYLTPSIAPLHLREADPYGSVAAGCSLAAYGRCSRGLINEVCCSCEDFHL